MALAALEKGYYVLTEKPISPSLSKCMALREAAHRAGRVVAVCHVLRYSPFYKMVKETIERGRCRDGCRCKAGCPLIPLHGEFKF